MTTHICPNCNNEFSGQFCNNCGQKLAHRITMGHIGHEIVHAFTHTDKGFFHVMLQMFRNPGKVTREYIIENKRKRYFSPFQYLIIIAAVGTFVVAGTHLMEEMSRAMSGSAASETPQGKMIQQVSAYQAKYFNFQILLQIPFFSFATFLIYRNHRLNYAEHLTMHCFVTAQTTLVSVALMLFIFILDKSNTTLMRVFFSIASAVSLLYQVGIYMLFFREKSFKGFLKALTTYVIGFLFFLITLLLILMIVILFYSLFTGKI